MEERLQKILARAGYGSRRANEELITEGRVTVNGQTATLGMKADPAKDRITVDGKAIPTAEPLVYIALYKPRGVLTTVDTPDTRKTVLDLVPVSERVYPVGRLDFDSEGLILLTNDGELANRLTHPRYGHEKEYRVLVAVQPDEAQLTAWRNGVVLEDEYRTRPVQVRVEKPHGKGTWLRVIMKEGRKRQIREMGSQTGMPVVRIIRVRIGSLQLGGLKPGDWRNLAPSEVAELKGDAPKGSGKGPGRRPGGRPPDRGSRASGPNRRPSRSRESGPERKPSRGPESGPDQKPSRGRQSGTDRSPGRGRDRDKPGPKK